jgi:hypothetical protein
MRISADAKPVVDSLEKIKANIAEKLKNMVVKTSGALVTIASDNTPVGDQDRIDQGGAYAEAYFQRQDMYGIDPTVGFHSGAWVVRSKPDSDFDPTIYEQEETVGEAYQSAKSIYNIGEDIYIVGKGPAYQFLETGGSPKAPMGIVQPTIDQIVDVFRVNVKSYYR